MTDWLEILKKEAKNGAEMARDVPQLLSDPAISATQAKALFVALEKQAAFVEKLRATLEERGYDFDIVKAAETLEERYADLAATAAERLKELRRLNG